MPINPFDETLRAIDDEQGQTPAPQRNPFEEVLEQQRRAGESALRTSLKKAEATTPDRAAEVARLAAGTGIAPAIVERNFDQIKQRAAFENTPFQQIMAQTPTVAEFISEPARLGIVKDDLAQLGAIEWLFQAPSRSFARGMAQIEVGRLRSASMYRELTREEHDKLNAAKFYMNEGGALGVGDSWFRGAVSGASGQLPILFGAVLHALKRVPIGAATGAAIGGGAGLLAGGVGAGPGALAGASFGAGRAGVIGGAEFAFQLEAGLALDEFLEQKDELGKPIDPNAAKAAAIAAGALNAGLEVVGLGILLKTIPGVDKLTGGLLRPTVAAALRQPTTRALLAQAGATYAGTVGKETLVEVAQRAITILAGEAAKQGSGQEFKPLTAGEVASDLGREAIGALQSFAFLSLPGPVSQAAIAQQRAQEAAKNVDFFKALAGAVTGSKTLERMPEALQDFITRATKDGPLERVYAPIDTFTTYWQSQNLDPAEVAKQLTGDSNAYEQALRTGEDLAIPTANYAVKVAGTEHNAFFANELRLAPGEMNAREAAAFIEEQKAAAEAALQDQGSGIEEQSATEPIRAALAQQLESAGVPRETAAAYIDLYESTFANLAERAGTDPVALFEQYGLTIDRPELAAPLREAAQNPEVQAVLTALANERVEEGAAARAAGTDVPDNPVAQQLERDRTAPAVEPFEATAFRGSRGGEELPGQFFTPDRDVAEAYGEVEERRLRFETPLYAKNWVEAKTALGLDQATDMAGLLEAAKQAGHDGIVFERHNGRPEYVILDRKDTSAQTTEGTEDVEAEPLPSRGVDQARSPAENRVAASDPGSGKNAGAKAEKHLAKVFGAILASARELDPQVNESELRAEFDYRVDLYMDQKQLAAESGYKPHDVLRAIASYGGISLDENAERASEIRQMFGGKTPAFGAVAGIRGVFRAKQRATTANKKSAGYSADVILQQLQADPEFSWIENLDMLMDQIDEAMRHSRDAIDASALPGTEELRDVNIRREANWWSRPWRPMDLLEEDVDESDIAGAEGDTSFDVSEFNQSLFDEFEALQPDDGADTLATGERQPRLPEAGAVREQEVATPEVADAPFMLTAPVAKPSRKAGPTEPSMSPEYAQALDQSRAASAAFTEATRAFRAREIDDAAYLSAREKNVAAEKAFDLAFEKEQARTTRTTLFQGGELTRESVQQWAQDIQTLAGEDLRSFVVNLTLDGDISLDSIIVARGAQRAGLGTMVIKQLTRFADMHGARLILTPGQRDPIHGTTSRDRLVRFYKRFGFVENKGRNKDFSISAGMLREPTLPQASVFNQPFYHGTPHDVDRFTVARVGTGEGSASYGWGLYFAENPDVAAHYRDSLSRGQSGGGVYQVEIPDQVVAKFLDWDAKLSEQPEAVQKFARRILVEASNGMYGRASDTNLGADPIGSRLYRETVSHVDRLWRAGKYPITGAEGASALLREAGIPGLRYLDQGSRAADKTEDAKTRNVVVFDDSVVTITHKDGTPLTEQERSEFLQGDDSVPAARRGAIRFGPDRQFTISLLERADLSTFLHESGHFFLEVLGDLVEQLRAVENPNAQQQQAIADYDTLLKWFGVENRAAIGTEQHEQFARGFEAYLLEGKAPSPALRVAFARFRAWLVGIYRSIKGLRVDLTDDVRRVMDRMVASDNAIARAEQEASVTPMFTTAEAAGMTAAEFELYRGTVAAASNKARETIETQLLAEVQREQEAQWKAQRAELREVVAAETYQLPVYQALAAMQKGTNPDGSPLIEGLTTPPLKLSRKLLVERFGAERLKRLPRPYIYSAEGGMDPGVVAGMYGWASADEMLEALESAEPMNQRIERETDRRMLEDHGSILLDGTLQERAQAAVANEYREQVIRAEVRALAARRRDVAPFVEAGEAAVDAERRERDYERRWLEAEAKLRIAIAAGRKQVEIDRLRGDIAALKAQARGGAATINAALPPADALREAAKVRIGATRFRELRPDVFWNASRKAGQKAIEAAARQDFEAAIVAKGQELMNLALFKEATAVRADIEKRVQKVLDLAKPAARKRLGLAGGSYLEQVDQILERYEFAGKSGRLLDRRESLRQWVNALQAQGLPVEIPEDVLDDSRRINFRELTVDELHGITDALDHIVHLARLKNKLLKTEAARELQATASELAASIREHYKGTRDKSIETRLPAEATARTLAGFFASHRKLASLARELDGFQDGGPMWEAIIRPVNEAGDREAEMNAAATRGLSEIVQAAYPGRDRVRLYEKVHIPAIGTSLSKMGRIMVAMNWGNEGNRQRIRGGYNWNDVQIQAILDTLDERDWKFVQGVWDFIDGYWPEIEAKQKRVTGVAPEKVQAIPIVTRFGTFKGGYFPIKYDDRQSAQAGAHLDLEAGNLQKQAAYVKATTKRGHTEARVAKVTMPVRLDLGVLFEHVSQVVHDLSHHEMLIDVGRLLGHRDVSKAIYDTYGEIVYRQFKDGVRDVAFGQTPAVTAFEKGINHLRSGATIAGLGWNLTTAMLQPLGLTQSMVRIGPKWVGRGLMRWTRDAVSMENTVAWINDRSTFMRLRGQTQQREINEIRNQVGVNTGRFSGWIDDVLNTTTLNKVGRQGVVDSFFFLIQQMQRVADVPTWLGQYEKSMAAGETEARAVALADQAVLDSQGGGQIKDLAGVQRGGPLLKLWTNFYSFFNTTYNLTVEATRRTSFTKPGEIGRLAVDYLLLYTIPASLGYLLREALKPGEDDESLVEGLIRENLGYLMGTVLGIRELSGSVQGYFGYEGPAGARAFSTAARLVKQIEQGEADAAFWRALNDLAGILFHYPSGQTRRTIEGTAAIAEGTTSNPGAVVVGAPREQ